MTMRDSQGSPLAASHIWGAPIRNVGTYASIGLSQGDRMVNGQRGNTRLRIQFRILRFVKLTGAFVRVSATFFCCNAVDG